MEASTFVFLAVLDNRLTEALKRALTRQFPGLVEETVSLLVLLISFVVGILGVILVFPSVNLFAGLGASTIAEQIATGVVIGGLANGIDFLSTRIARPEVTARTATLEVVATETKSANPAA